MVLLKSHTQVPRQNRDNGHWTLPLSRVSSWWYYYLILILLLFKKASFPLENVSQKVFVKAATLKSGYISRNEATS